VLDLVQAAAKLQTELDTLGLPNCVIGGLALQAWGEVRLTRDADFTVLTRFIDEETKARSILSLMTPRRPDALDFGLQNRVLLGFVEGNISIDIGMGGFDFEERIVERSRSVELAPSVWLRVCSAEDLVVMKAFAGRDRDWVDIKGIVARQAALNWDQIELELPPLLELAAEPERLDKLLELRKR
jgi:hypothetical protein